MFDGPAIVVNVGVAVWLSRDVTAPLEALDARRSTDAPESAASASRCRLDPTPWYSLPLLSNHYRMAS